MFKAYEDAACLKTSLLVRLSQHSSVEQYLQAYDASVLSELVQDWHHLMLKPAASADGAAVPAGAGVDPHSS